MCRNNGVNRAGGGYLCGKDKQRMTHIATIASKPALVLIQAAFGATCVAYLQEASIVAFKWFVPCFFVIMADLATGVHASKARGEKVSGSTMWRRTINKIVAYLSWILFAVTCGIQYGKEFLCPLMMSIVLMIEAMSAVNNVLEPHGLKLSYKGVLKVVGSKASLDGLEDVVEEK